MKKLIGLFAAIVLLSPALAFASVGITLSGPNPAGASVGQSFVEPGYSAFSTVDGNVTNGVVVTGPNTSVSGTSFRIYSIVDSAESSYTVSREVIVSGGGGAMPYCSGPYAPGWDVNLPGGGCGGILLSPGQVLVGGVTPQVCPFWFPQGCIIKTK